MSTWQGISHARMTRSMHALPGGAYKVLAAVRRLIPDGARRKISQADIARRAGVSEGTVSAAMKDLDGPYLVRHHLGRGRGRGYEIELLPPPEQRPLELTAPPKGSISDPCDRSFSEGAPTPQTPAQEGSDSDPSIFSLHAHEQQQQTASPSEATTEPEPAAQLAPETIAALEQANAHPKLIQRVAANNPGCTPADVATALARAHEKPNAYLPPGLALECLATRQQVVVPRARPSPDEKPQQGGKSPRGGKDGAEPHDASKIDWGALRREEEARIGLRPSAPLPAPPARPAGAPAPSAPPAPPGRDLEALMAAAAALLGDRPPEGLVEREILRQCLDAGGTPEQAAAALRRRRDRPQRPKERAPAYYRPLD